MDINSKDRGPAGPRLVDSLKDFSLEIPGRTAAVEGRRVETLERLDAGTAAALADTVEAQVGKTAEIGRDNVVTKAEVAALEQQKASLGETKAAVNAELPLLKKLVERPKPEAIDLPKAVRTITRHVSSPYDPNFVDLSALPPGIRKLALEVLDTLDAVSSKPGAEVHDLREDRRIDNAILARFQALSDHELLTFGAGSPGQQRSVAAMVHRHINSETEERLTEPKNPRAVRKDFPVEGASVALETVPLPDYSKEGRRTYHNLNRVLLVKVPPGHKVLINAQSPMLDAQGKQNGLELMEQLLKPTEGNQRHELAYLPGIKDGKAAELWVTVLKGDQVVSNRNFAVPENPITSETVTVRT